MPLLTASCYTGALAVPCLLLTAVPLAPPGPTPQAATAEMSCPFRQVALLAPHTFQRVQQVITDALSMSKAGYSSSIAYLRQLF